jgi:hypothetical protein
MSWSGTSDNQIVSFNTLKNAVDNGYFDGKITQSTSSEMINKTDANDYVFIDTAYSLYANKSSNQLIAKRDLIPLFQCNDNVNFFVDEGIFNVGTSSGNIIISGTVNISTEYEVRYPANGGGSVLDTQTSDGSGNIFFAFSFTYSGGSGSNILIQRSSL